MNIYHLKHGVYKFTSYNEGLLERDAEFQGHYDVYVNPITRQFCIRKMGDFGTLTRFPETDDDFATMSVEGYQYWENKIALAFWKSGTGDRDLNMLVETLGVGLTEWDTAAIKRLAPDWKGDEKIYSVSRLVKRFMESENESL